MAAIVPIPSIVLITGKVGSGKSTEGANVVDDVMGPTIDRLISVCPTHHSQKLFRRLDPYIHNPSDVITKPRKNLWDNISQNVLDIYQNRVEKGKDPPHTVLFIDDLAGTKFVQDRGMGDFSNLMVQTRHRNMSVVAIFQQPKLAAYTLRANANVVIAFPSLRDADMDWLVTEYKNPSISKKDFQKLINHAWRGARNDDTEWGQHFLVIIIKARRFADYYMDWTYKLDVDANPQPTKKRRTK